MGNTEVLLEKIELLVAKVVRRAEGAGYKSRQSLISKSSLGDGLTQLPHRDESMVFKTGILRLLLRPGAPLLDYDPDVAKANSRMRNTTFQSRFLFQNSSKHYLSAQIC